jgi:corrinoid protein of di/trimethylamine methyltransferase
MHTELFQAMAKSIIDGDTDEAEKLAKQSIELGIDPLEAINEGFVNGVNYVGNEFSCGNAFLPELVMAGEAMKTAVATLEPEMARRGTERQVLGKVVLATVQGDIHEIGKTLVGTMLSASGFKTYDLGVDVPVTRIIEKVREVNANIVAVSALLTTTMVRQRDVVEALDDVGLRPKVKVMVGGAPVTHQWAKEIGADGYSEDAIGNIKSITNPALRLDILSPDDVQRIHSATLEIIEKTGVRFPSPKALDIWEAHGASVDRDTSIVKAPARIIEEALKQAPPTYTLAARDPAQDLPLDGNHVYLGTDGCGVEVIDIHTSERRRSCWQDVADIARIADYLEEIAFHWVAVSAQDRPPQSRGLHELAAVIENSTKHVQTESIYNEKEARAAIEMAAAIAGGRQALRQRPVLSMMQCTAPPLGQDGGSLEAALVAAEAGIPVGFMTMAAALTTGPATIAGTLAVGNAEVISATALIQLAHPGAPVFYAAAQTASDPRTGVYTGGGPEDYLFGAATNVLSDFYNIPLSMGSFATGAKEPDWQAGIDNSLSTFMACIVMSDMLLGVGFLHGSRIWSYEQMLMDCEIFNIVHKTLQGIPVNDETLALDTIHAVGPGGSFLTQKHTRKHMRDLFLPQFMDRRPYNLWEEKRDGARQWALAKAQQILSTHQLEALDAQLSVELKEIIASVEKE